MCTGDEPLYVDRVGGEGGEPTQDTRPEEGAEETLSAPRVGDQDHQDTDQRTAQDVDRQGADGEGPRGGRPRLSDQVPHCGTGRATCSDGGQHRGIAASATTQPAGVQIDVGVDRLKGCGVCVFGGVLVRHRHDLPTWTGLQGTALQGLQVGTVGHPARVTVWVRRAPPPVLPAEVNTRVTSHTGMTSWPMNRNGSGQGNWL